MVKIKCKHGHRLNSVNMYVSPQGYIRCRVCGSEKVRRYYQRNKLAIRLYKKLKAAA